MRTFFKKTLPLLMLFSLLLCLPCLGAEPQEYAFKGRSLDKIIAEFMAENGLNENNFSMGWYNTGTGESWYYNPDKYITAGSLYKVPLNMRYAQLLNGGTLSPDDRVGGYPVSFSMYLSLVCSSNEVSHAMIDALGLSYTEYRDMLVSFSALTPEELPAECYREDKACPRLVLTTLINLYENSSDYADVIGLMKEASPGHYFQLYQGEYEIAHKYGNLYSALNDCAIVYTPTPFLLVAFTDGVPWCEQVLGSLCRLMTEYSLYLDTLTPEEPPDFRPVFFNAPDLPQPESPPGLPAETPEPLPEEPESGNGAPSPLWSLLPPCLVLLAGVALLCRKRKRK